MGWLTLGGSGGLSPVDLTGLVDGQGIFYRDPPGQWENAWTPEPLTDETPAVLFLMDGSVAMSEPFYD